MLVPFIHGFMLALGLILPLGIQNMFVLQQGAVQPRWTKALPVVVTAALCDTVLIMASVWGVSLLIFHSKWVRTLLIGAGFIFLIYMGWTAWRSKPSQEKPAYAKSSVRQQVLFAASVSILNPHAILDTAGVIGTGSLQYEGFEKTMFAAACILVSWLWFSGLSLIGRMVGNIDRTGRTIAAFQKLSALVMWGSAVVLVLQS